MTDRDKDLAALAVMGGARRIPGRGVVASLVCAGFVMFLAFMSPPQGQARLILVALLMALGSMGMVIQYCVSGPLMRELQRLRAELDELRGHDDTG